MEKKIILVGNGPLLTSQTLNMNAYSLRTIQFMDGLKNDLNEVYLLDRKDNYKNKKFPDISGVKFFEHFSDLKKEIKRNKIGMLISVNNYTSYLCCKIRGDFYRVCDLNGTLTYELQAQCDVEQNDFRSWIISRRQRLILKKADFITCVSESQKDSILGQLGILNFNGYKNLKKSLVEVIENGQVSKDDKFYNKKEFIIDLPKNAKKILFLGSFNNWVDEQTLIEAFNLTKKEIPECVLILTGKKNSEFGNKKYEKFISRAKELNIIDSIFHLGFIDYLDMKSLIEFCDIGVVTDLSIYESRIGARNRINEMMKFKLPVVCTLNSSISHFLKLLNQNMVANSLDPKSLSKSMIWSLKKENNQELNAYVKEFNDRFLDNKNLLNPITNYIKKPFKKEPFDSKLLSFLQRLIKKKFNL